MKKYLSVFIITMILCMAGLVFGQLTADWNPGNTLTVNAEGEPWATVDLSTTAVTLTYSTTITEGSVVGTVDGQPFTLTIDTNVSYVITAEFTADTTYFSGKTVKLMFGEVDLLTSPNSITGEPTQDASDVHTLTVAPVNVSDLKYFRGQVEIGTITFTVAEQQ
ncbi:MAG: hypothetical protein WBH84_03460 [Defluviitoga tunisiensis]|jgi:hypothetical protein|uniref:Uncharacterized protein n=1 Tax=Defluviitoga tunisiensis TaxID=1006576 RepID=A0A0C7P540_DEFTU|nr:hypothetical protein [Defluviitoga tunisiensis]CEP78939.1 hypothetical protein DTL3_1650 [Defluviitoga tunisiensis]